MGLRDSSDNNTIPRITVPSFREDGRIVLQGRVLGVTDAAAADVGIHKELPHSIGRQPQGDVGQD